MPNIPTLLTQLMEANQTADCLDKAIAAIDQSRTKLNHAWLQQQLWIAGLEHELAIARVAVEEGDSRESV